MRSSLFLSARTSLLVCQLSSLDAKFSLDFLSILILFEYYTCTGGLADCTGSGAGSIRCEKSSSSGRSQQSAAACGFSCSNTIPCTQAAGRSPIRAEQAGGSPLRSERTQPAGAKGDSDWEALCSLHDFEEGSRSYPLWACKCIFCMCTKGEERDWGVSQLPCKDQFHHPVVWPMTPLFQKNLFWKEINSLFNFWFITF